MNGHGFQLRELSVRGPGVDHGQVRFTPGLNVIAGASDTGKSYVLRCIAYMLGAAKPPKPVEESTPYQTLLLEIEAATQARWTLRRGLRGGAFVLFNSAIGGAGRSVQGRQLTTKRNARADDSISSFLLGLAGFRPARVRRNAYNETEDLTIGSLVHLFMVDETRIMADASLLTSTAVCDENKARAVFNFVLTGADDSGLVARVGRRAQRTRVIAQREVYDQLIAPIRERMQQHEGEADSRRERIEALEVRMAAATARVVEVQAFIQRHQQVREEAWNAEQAAASRIITIDELVSRFGLLEQHYLTDIQRLEFVTEGEHYLGQLAEVPCPLCGAAMDGHPAGGLPSTAGAFEEDIAGACQREASKIHTHLGDLRATVETLRRERLERAAEVAEQRTVIAERDRIIAEELRPILMAGQEELDQLMADHATVADLEADGARLDELEAARALLVDDFAQADGEEQSVPPLNPGAIRTLCDTIAEVLTNWRYPNVGTVDFSEDDLDIVVAAKGRQIHGKGHRAILHAAFVIGLMRYCKLNGRPHPGVVVLDSPLVTLREGGVLPVEVQTAFYEDLSRAPDDEQIIVIENKEPNPEVQSRINYIEFAGRDGDGRHGFYPERHTLFDQ